MDIVIRAAVIFCVFIWLLMRVMGPPRALQHGAVRPDHARRLSAISWQQGVTQQDVVGDGGAAGGHDLGLLTILLAWFPLPLPAGAGRR